MKILLLGKDGQVGWELHRCLLPLGEVIALERPDIDFSVPESLRSLVREVKPDVIANCVAYTAVDKAESEEELAMRINAQAVSVLAEETKKRNALLVHYSTDYVFDGTKAGPYTEEDVPCPLSVYGKSKLAGDEVIQASGCRHLIARTSWVYGSRGHNFMLTMLRLAKERSELRIVDDQVGAPTWARSLAVATAEVLAQIHCIAGAQRNLFNPGIINMACSGLISWRGFASAIFEHASSKGLCSAPCVVPIPSSAYPSPAARPANSALDMQKLKSEFGLYMPDWNEALSLCMDELK